MRFHWLLGAALIGIAGATRTASGQSGEDAERAASAFAQGKAAAREGDWENAHRFFQESWIMNPAYDTAANLGYSALKLERHAEAARALAYALGHFPATGARAKRAELNRLFALARRKVTAVVLEVQPASAEVLVDGAPRTGGETLFFDPGEHVIEVRENGYEPARRTLVAIANTEQALRVELGETAAPPAAPRPSAPAALREAPAPAARPVEAPRPAVETESERSLAPAIVAGGIAVVGMAAGIGFTLSASSKESEADDLRSTIGPSGCYSRGDSAECTRLRDLEGSEDRHRTFGTVGFVVGGLGAGAAAAYLLWPSFSSPRPPTRAGLAAAPLLGPGRAAITVSGRF